MSEPVLSTRDFDHLRELIEGWCGIAVDSSKTYLIETRLRHLVGETGCSSYSEFYDKALCASDALRDQIIDSITTNETSWFRDAPVYRALRSTLIPDVYRRMEEGMNERGAQGRLRIWSAACSTGQEPYSIAILLREMERSGEIPAGAASQVEILATDVCRAALALAGLGRYDPISIRRGLSSDLRDRYFEKQGRVSIVRPEIREAVTFRRFNLLEPLGTLGTFDLVLMRNVMIYFSTGVKKHMLARVLQILRSEATVVVGATESLERYTREYEALRLDSCTYYRARAKEEGETR